MTRMPDPLNIFMTEIFTRNPQYKIHTSLGRAKSAFSHGGWEYAREGRIYQLVDNEWEVLYDVPRHTPRNHLPWH